MKEHYDVIILGAGAAGLPRRRARVDATTGGGGAASDPAGVQRPGAACEPRTARLVLPGGAFVGPTGRRQVCAGDGEGRRW